ncbi:hypothetical protein ILT44_08260 [Microvirga sp. BT689]|uniref:calcium-binding protein n=1 Tax=Microvirga arvi TaxID=2778731 RepID=UPI00194DFF25|nr:calcium-binding protein [Microvirga arvi]MBM6580171.1 hypothetical protein [Microvirga arvi]
MATRRVNSEGVAVGTSSSDKVYGDNRANVLAGAGGNDTLWGKGGVDIIDAGSGNDKIDGGTGNDFLSGGLGQDTLIGGAGYDYFGFDTRPSGSNIDVIDDFSVKYDSIALSKKIFKISANSKGYISSSAFWTGSSAHDSNDRLIYDNNTGALYYDADGTGPKAAVQFAQLDANLKLTYKDFGML